MPILVGQSNDMFPPLPNLVQGAGGDGCALPAGPVGPRAGAGLAGPGPDHQGRGHAPQDAGGPTQVDGRLQGEELAVDVVVVDGGLVVDDVVVVVDDDADVLVVSVDDDDADVLVVSVDDDDADVLVGAVDDDVTILVILLLH